MRLSGPASTRLIASCVREIELRVRGRGPEASDGLQVGKSFGDAIGADEREGEIAVSADQVGCEAHGGFVTGDFDLVGCWLLDFGCCVSSAFVHDMRAAPYARGKRSSHIRSETAVVG